MPPVGGASTLGDANPLPFPPQFESWKHNLRCAPSPLPDQGPMLNNIPCVMNQIVCINSSVDEHVSWLLWQMLLWTWVLGVQISECLLSILLGICLE